MMQKAPEHYYDVILMDIQMPNLDGYGATKRIRAMEDSEKANIPIVAMTANACHEHANQLGIDLFTAMNSYVDSVLLDIEKKYGSDARELMVDRYIYCMDYDAIEKKYNLNKQAANFQFFKILNGVIYDE